MSATKYLARLVVATILATMSFTLFFSLLGVVLLRPSWCPSAICSPAQPIYRQGSVHDGNLELYVTGIQATTYVIPGDPTRYTLSNLPENIAAVRLDQAQDSVPYRVVVSVHSVQQGDFGVIIDGVDLVIVQVPPTPNPLNVWATGTPAYTSNPFQCTYEGQTTGSALVATSEVNPGARVGLAPGETDSLAIRLTSLTLADVQFRVQITYHVTNESIERTLLLPTVFEVIFADASNWHPYTLQNGQLMPSPTGTPTA